MAGHAARMCFGAAAAANGLPSITKLSTNPVANTLNAPNIVIALGLLGSNTTTPNFSQMSWWAFVSLSSNPMSDSRGIPAKARGALLVQFWTTLLHSGTVGSFAGTSDHLHSPSGAGGGGVITLF